jgi:hypothetical protein
MFEIDSVSPIPFVAIGLKQKAIGTLTNENGAFSFKTDATNNKDSIQIIAIGYKPITISVQNYLQSANKNFYLEKLANDLEEVSIAAKKIKKEVLGNNKYSKINCTGFVKGNSNWIGSETALLAGNKEGRRVLIESFSFYVIQNKYQDSLKFRLVFYEASAKKWPRLHSFMRKPVYFKIGQKNGEYTLNLRDFNIYTSHDFFISLECLSNEIDISKFCYAGSYSSPSFVRPTAFQRWYKGKGGGADLSVTVSYSVD